jgi:hypothetical protein
LIHAGNIGFPPLCEGRLSISRLHDRIHYTAALVIIGDEILSSTRTRISARLRRQISRASASRSARYDVEAIVEAVNACGRVMTICSPPAASATHDDITVDATAALGVES